MRSAKNMECKPAIRFIAVPCLGSNCAGLMHLISGFDPQQIGAYPDPGHLLLDGEDWAMGLAMIGDYLSVSSESKMPSISHSLIKLPPYVPCFVKVGDGCVDWGRYLGLLCKSGFDVPLTVHTEYRFDESIIRQVGYAETTPPNLEQWAKEDAVYLRNVLSSLGVK